MAEHLIIWYICLQPPDTSQQSN